MIKKEGCLITDKDIPEFSKIKKISRYKKLKLDYISTDYGRQGMSIISHRFENEKQIVELKYKKSRFKFKINLIGKIQLKNVLMSVIAAEKGGIKISNIISNISKLKSINGRIEKIGLLKNNAKVILDYAHTPAALKIVLENLREQFPEKRISIVFGCGGDRDKLKKVLMGKVADKFCQKIYLTDDNPRNENPKSIRKEIKKGIKKFLIEIPDRKLAIKSAVLSLQTSEILLVAGKGHEMSQTYKK